MHTGLQGICMHSTRCIVAFTRVLPLQMHWYPMPGHAINGSVPTHECMECIPCITADAHALLPFKAVCLSRTGHKHCQWSPLHCIVCFDPSH